MMISGMLTLGDHFISRMIGTAGRDQLQWSSDYRLFSESPWQLDALFAPVIQEALKQDDPNSTYLAMALDDTGLPRVGKHIPGAQYMRDPLSPPFQVNLTWGLRFIQCSHLLPLHRQHGVASRGIPVLFKHVPFVKSR
jgi:hypothetical protein